MGQYKKIDPWGWDLCTISGLTIVNSWVIPSERGCWERLGSWNTIPRKVEFSICSSHFGVRKVFQLFSGIKLSTERCKLVFVSRSNCLIRYLTYWSWKFCVLSFTTPGQHSFHFGKLAKFARKWSSTIRKNTFVMLNKTTPFGSYARWRRKTKPPEAFLKFSQAPTAIQRTRVSVW